MPVQIFVPRWMDRSNTNAQNANARALLSRFTDPRAHWTAVCTREPADSIRRNRIDTVRIPGSRFWELRLARAYQAKFDGVFYPGPHWGDRAGLSIHRLLRKPTKVIATLEGVIASPDSIRKVSNLVGHPVFSQPNTEKAIPRIRWLYERADQIIAISPFLARVATCLYGEKVSYLPLGVDGSIFHSADRQEPSRCRVVGCGTVKSSKNPQTFLSLAARYKEIDFVWFGDGETRAALVAKAKQERLENLKFPGAIPPGTLAEEFRRSSIFVLPSHSEGAPKVVQEAAACGLPVVLQGFFEAPAVAHQQNGLVAWSDEELSDHVGALIQNPEARLKLGRRGAEMAKEWDWDRVAPQWEELVIGAIGA